MATEEKSFALYSYMLLVLYAFVSEISDRKADIIARFGIDNNLSDRDIEYANRAIRITAGNSSALRLLITDVVHKLDVHPKESKLEVIKQCYLLSDAELTGNEVKFFTHISNLLHIRSDVDKLLDDSIIRNLLAE